MSELPNVLGQGKRNMLFFFDPKSKVCKKMFPMMDVFSNRIKKRINTYSVDVSTNPEAWMGIFKGSLMTTPTTVILHNGAIERIINGEQTEDSLLHSLKGLV